MEATHSDVAVWVKRASSASCSDAAAEDTEEQEEGWRPVHWRGAELSPSIALTRGHPPPQPMNLETCDTSYACRDAQGRSHAATPSGRAEDASSSALLLHELAERLTRRRHHVVGEWDSMTHARLMTRAWVVWRCSRDVQAVLLAGDFLSWAVGRFDLRLHTSCVDDLAVSLENVMADRVSAPCGGDDAVVVTAMVMERCTRWSCDVAAVHGLIRCLHYLDRLVRGGSAEFVVAVLFSKVVPVTTTTGECDSLWRVWVRRFLLAPGPTAPHDATQQESVTLTSDVWPEGDVVAGRSRTICLLSSVRRWERRRRGVVTAMLALLQHLLRTPHAQLVACAVLDAAPPRHDGGGATYAQGATSCGSSAAGWVREVVWLVNVTARGVADAANGVQARHWAPLVLGCAHVDRLLVALFEQPRRCAALPTAARALVQRLIDAHAADTLVSLLRHTSLAPPLRRCVTRLLLRLLLYAGGVATAAPDSRRARRRALRRVDVVWRTPHLFHALCHLIATGTDAVEGLLGSARTQTTATVVRQPACSGSPSLVARPASEGRVGCDPTARHSATETHLETVTCDAPVVSSLSTASPSPVYEELHVVEDRAQGAAVRAMGQVLRTLHQAVCLSGAASLTLQPIVLHALVEGGVMAELLRLLRVVVGPFSALGESYRRSRGAADPLERSCLLRPRMALPTSSLRHLLHHIVYAERACVGLLHGLLEGCPACRAVFSHSVPLRQALRDYVEHVSSAYLTEDLSHRGVTTLAAALDCLRMVCTEADSQPSRTPPHPTSTLCQGSLTACMNCDRDGVRHIVGDTARPRTSSRLVRAVIEEPRFVAVLSRMVSRPVVNCQRVPLSALHLINRILTCPSCPAARRLGLMVNTRYVLSSLITTMTGQDWAVLQMSAARRECGWVRQELQVNCVRLVRRWLSVTGVTTPPSSECGVAADFLDALLKSTLLLPFLERSLQLGTTALRALTATSQNTSADGDVVVTTHVPASPATPCHEVTPRRPARCHAQELWAQSGVAETTDTPSYGCVRPTATTSSLSPSRSTSASSTRTRNDEQCRDGHTAADGDASQPAMSDTNFELRLLHEVLLLVQEMAVHASRASPRRCRDTDGDDGASEEPAWALRAVRSALLDRLIALFQCTLHTQLTALQEGVYPYAGHPCSARGVADLAASRRYDLFLLTVETLTSMLGHVQSAEDAPVCDVPRDADAAHAVLDDGTWCGQDTTEARPPSPYAGVTASCTTYYVHPTRAHSSASRVSGEEDNSSGSERHVTRSSTPAPVTTTTAPSLPGSTPRTTWTADDAARRLSDLVDVHVLDDYVCKVLLWLHHNAGQECGAYYGPSVMMNGHGHVDGGTSRGGWRESVCHETRNLELSCVGLGASVHGDPDATAVSACLSRAVDCVHFLIKLVKHCRAHATSS